MFFMNYSFLSFYYLENNKYIYKYMKKNMLLYRMFSNITAFWCNFSMFDYYNKSIDFHPHKCRSLKNPIVRKKWYFNWVKRLKKQQLFSPLMKNKTNNKDIFQSHFKYRPKLMGMKLFMILNFAFKGFWSFFSKMVIVKFFDMITLINKIDNLYTYFLNFKYSLEFILWEIFNSNNLKFINYKNYLSFYFIFKKMKLDNLLSFFYTKYYNSMLYSLLFYNNNNNNEYFINCMFMISFLCDLFFNMIMLKNKFIFDWFVLFFSI